MKQSTSHSVVYILSIMLIFQMSAQASNLLIGTIKFPETIKEIPLIPLWSSGFLLKREADQKAKELTFQVPRYQNQTTFYLIVTEAVYPIKIDTDAQANNVAYLRIPEQQPYKLFYIEMRPGTLDVLEETEKKDSIPPCTWFIEEHILHEPERRIPDNAIILLYRPDAITHLEGGSNFALPTVKIKENLLELFGSEEKFAEDAVRCTIASIGVNTFHSIFPQTIKVDKGRMLVASIT